MSLSVPNDDIIPCSVCTKSVGYPRRLHPTLGTYICRTCYYRIFNCTDTNGARCIWCYKAIPDHELAHCGACSQQVCRRCVSKNFGAAYFKRLRLMGKTWRCFACHRDAFEAMCAECGVGVKPRQPPGSRSKKTRVICSDISNGLEHIQIPVINDVDRSPPPVDFTYIVQNVLGSGVNIINRNPNFLSCCSCKDSCSDPKVCECAMAMAGFAYDRDSKYFSDKPGGVYECNYMCSCHKDLCRNRIVGNGPRMPLEVFRCAEVGKGWGVRCAVDLPIGTFIADYLGEILNEVDAESRVEADEYLFGLDAYARSYACQVLTDVGLKKVELPAAEEACNVNGISRNRMETMLGSEIAQKVFERPKVCALINYEADDSKMVIHDKKQKRSLNSTYSDTMRGAGSRKRDLSILLGSQLTGAASSDYLRDDKDIDQPTSRKKQMRDARILLMERAMTEAESKNNTYTLDANHYGNVARFLNHSCQPNVEKVTVFSDSQDVRVPRYCSKVALFSNQLIPAGTELCYDYGYFQGNVEGKHRKCLCGTEKCRGNMY